MKNILLVEDDAIIASGLVYALEQEGYAVTHSKNVRDARRAIVSGNFDLAILDMQLPDGTGFDVRETLKGSNMAVIFLTVVDDECNIVRAFEGGADDYILQSRLDCVNCLHGSKGLYPRGNAALGRAPLSNIGCF